MSRNFPLSYRADPLNTGLFQNVPVIVLLVDPETTAIVDANDHALRFYGWDLETLRTMTLSGINTLSEDEVVREVERAREEDRDYCEFFHRTSRGAVVPVDVYHGLVPGSETPETPETPETSSLQLTVVHDATEKHAARTERTRLLRMQEQTLSAIRGLVTVLDRDFNILYSNWHGYENSAGRRRQSSPQCFTVFYKRESLCPWCPVPQVFRTGKPLTRIMENLPDKRVRLISVVPIPGDNHQVEMVVEHVQDITESVQNREALAREVKQNETLIREVYHRVKNNLQVIASIIDLTARTAACPEAQKTLRDTRNRIFTMALVHQTLYQSEELESVRIDTYLEHLTADLRRSLDRTDMQVTFNLDVTRLSLAQGVALAQIAGELITNALRFGRDRVRIELVHRDTFAAIAAVGAVGAVGAEKSPPAAELTVEDDGPGFPDTPPSVTPSASDSQPENPADKLGLILVEALSDQLRGHFLRDASPDLGGACARLLFPLDDAAPGGSSVPLQDTASAASPNSAPDLQDRE